MLRSGQTNTMKFKLFILAILLPILGRSQGIIGFTDLNGGQILISVTDVQYAVSNGSGSTLVFDGRKNKIDVQDSLGVLLNGSCNLFIDVTSGSRNLINKNNIRSISQDGAGAKIVMTNGRSVSAPSTPWSSVLSQASVIPGCGGGVSLSYGSSPVNGTVISNSGTNAIIPAGSETVASLMLPSDKTKLNGLSGVASGSVSGANIVLTMDDASTVTVTNGAANITTGTLQNAAGPRVIPMNNNDLIFEGANVYRENAVSYVQGNGSGANLADIDSDAVAYIKTTQTSNGQERRMNKLSSQTLIGASDPVDGTTIAWYQGQLYRNTTSNELWASLTKSTNPDGGGGGSTWVKIPTGGGSDIEETVSISGGNEGSNLEVTATATGTTASFASNKYTIVIPANELLRSASLKIAPADVQASADGSGVTNWVLVQIDGLPQNNNLSNPKLPSVQKISIPNSGALSVTNAASVDQDNSPALAWVALGTQSATLRIGGLSVGAQGYLITLNF